MEAAAEIMAGAVVSAVVQEAVSRGIPSVLGKRKEKVSQQEFLYERLETAVYTIALAFERAAKLPAVTEVSQLRRWANLKHQYMEATNLLGKLHKKRKAQQQQETGQPLVARPSSSFPSPDHHGRRRRWVTIPAALLSFVSSIVGRLNSNSKSKDDESLCLSHETVDRFERLAVSARDFLESVKYGCSLRCQMVFSGPLVSQLLEEKTLTFKSARESRQQRRLEITAVRLQERGVEAWLTYEYIDHESRDKSFELHLLLRLSESTDIVQVAIQCLKSLESQFKLILAPAIGELTLLAGSPDITAHPYAPTKTSIQEHHTQWTHVRRSDPVCCSSASCLHEPCASDMASSEFSKMFPEEVIMFGIRCSISSTRSDHKLLPPGRSSSDEASTKVVMRDPTPHLQLSTWFLPHFVPSLSPAFEDHGFIWQPTAHLNCLVECLQNMEGVIDQLVEGHTKCSIRQAAEKAIEGLFLLQEQRMLEKRSATLRGGDSQLRRKFPMEYDLVWFSKHGVASFEGKII